jgi:hypothetical protein
MLWRPSSKWKGVFSMNRILLIVLALIFAVAAVAVADQQVTFQWDDTNSPAPDGFRLFIRQQTGVFDYKAPVYEGANKRAPITLPDGKYAAVVRAYSGTVESSNSNEVLFTIEPDPPAMVIPGRPRQLTIVFE